MRPDAMRPEAMRPGERAAVRRRRSRLAAGLAAVLAVPVAVMAVSAWPSAAAAGPSAGGVYELASGKCIDVSGAGTANMVLLVQVACGAGRPISSSPLWRRAAGSVW